MVTELAIYLYPSNQSKGYCFQDNLFLIETVYKEIGTLVCGKQYLHT